MGGAPNSAVDTPVAPRISEVHMNAAPPDNRAPVLRMRVAPALLHAVDRAADHGGQSRSAVVRAALVSDLTRRGLWPPKAATDAK